MAEADSAAAVDAAKAAKVCAVRDYMRIDGDEDGFRRHPFCVYIKSFSANCRIIPS